MNKGKAICEILKQIRIDIAKANNIEYHPTECTHKGPCTGTCPRCEEELHYLNTIIAHRQEAGIEPNFERCKNLEDMPDLMAEYEKEQVIVDNTRDLFRRVLAGDPRPPEWMTTDQHIFPDEEDVLQGEPREIKPTIESKPKKKRKVVTNNDILLTHILVAGTTHSERFDEVSWEIEKGDKMTMKRNPRNKYDKNAIGIYYRNIRIGWVPKSENEILAHLMDGDRRLYFLTSSVEDRNGWIKIEGDVYMIK